MQKFYFDTAIWRDYYENRSDNFRPLGEWAFGLIKKVIECESIVFYSDLVMRELLVKYDVGAVNKIFEGISKTDLLIKVGINAKQYKEAAQLSRKRKIPFADVLHAILARDNHAILVTRDKHFTNLSDIVEIKKPEELI